MNNTNSSCKSPQKFDEYLNYKHDTVSVDAGFPDGTEILFSCIPSVTGETKTWKIVCEAGIWVGRAVPCGELIFFHPYEYSHQIENLQTFLICMY